MKTLNVIGQSQTVNVPIMKVVYTPNGPDEMEAELIEVQKFEAGKDEDGIYY